MNVATCIVLFLVLLAFAVQKKLDQMGIENEVINFMTQKLDTNGEIPSVHKEEKASSVKSSDKL